MYAKKIQNTEKTYAEVSKKKSSFKELDAFKLKAKKEERKRKALEQKLASFEKEKQKRIELEKKLVALQLKGINSLNKSHLMK